MNRIASSPTNRRIHNALRIRLAGEQPLSCDTFLGPGDEPPLGSHLVTPRTLYSHHGIYVGSGRVIHYAGLAHGLRRGPVENVSLERFARGRGIRIRHESSWFDSREVVERARSRLGECRYRLMTNNCEHFCTWALRDENRSRQVEYLRTLPRTVWRKACAVLERSLKLQATLGVDNPSAFVH